MIVVLVLYTFIRAQRGWVGESLHKPCVFHPNSSLWPQLALYPFQVAEANNRHFGILHHQLRARPACTSMPFGQILYHWLLNLNVFILISLKPTMDWPKVKETKAHFTISGMYRLKSLTKLTQCDI